MTKSKTLYRIASLAEVRTSGDGRTLTGWAVPFDEEAEIRSPVEGHFLEVFRKGAFARTIQQRSNRIPLNLLHDRRTRLPIGKATTLREEDRGLFAEFKVSATTAGDEALALVADGVPVGLSIGFTPMQDRWSRKRDRVERLEVRLEEVSIVNQPAYAGAQVVGLRALDDPGPPPYAIDLAVARLRALQL